MHTVRAQKSLIIADQAFSVQEKIISSSLLLHHSDQTLRLSRRRLQ
jgi:hypothetical protein